MKCHRCDEECTREDEHYYEAIGWDGTEIQECSRWRCEAIDWRKRALDAEARVKQLEASVRNLWETSNA